LTPDRLPEDIHLRKSFPAGICELVVFSFWAIRGFGLGGFYKSVAFESTENDIDSAFAYEKAEGFAELSFYFIAIHSAVAYIIEDRKFEETSAGLICPISEKGGIHVIYDNKISLPVNTT
jgi:hypothetical protein